MRIRPLRRSRRKQRLIRLRFSGQIPLAQRAAPRGAGNLNFTIGTIQHFHSFPALSLTRRIVAVASDFNRDAALGDLPEKVALNIRFAINAGKTQNQLILIGTYAKVQYSGTGQHIQSAEYPRKLRGMATLPTLEITAYRPGRRSAAQASGKNPSAQGARCAPENYAQTPSAY
jgi:hypothetical protein